MMTPPPAGGIQDFRKFGFMMGGLFALIGSWPFLFSNGEVRVWALAVSAILLLAGGLVPQSLQPVYQGWMWIGALLGWINTRIILALCFYILVFPIGCVMRLLGKDPLLKHWDSSLHTYRMPRQGPQRSQMEKQY